MANQACRSEWYKIDFWWSIRLKMALCGCSLTLQSWKELHLKPSQTLLTLCLVKDLCVLISVTDSPVSSWLFSFLLVIFASLPLCPFSPPSPPSSQQRKRSPSVATVRPNQTPHLLIRATFTSIFNKACHLHAGTYCE